MGRTYNLTIPAAGVGVDPVPISVSGATQLSGESQYEVAYDPADFDSNQFTLLNPGISNLPIMTFAPNTILWVRQPPTGGAPAAVLYILTQIGTGAY